MVDFLVLRRSSFNLDGLISTFSLTRGGQATGDKISHFERHNADSFAIIHPHNTEKIF